MGLVRCTLAQRSSPYQNEVHVDRRERDLLWVPLPKEPQCLGVINSLCLPDLWKFSLRHLQVQFHNSQHFPSLISTWMWKQTVSRRICTWQVPLWCLPLAAGTICLELIPSGGAAPPTQTSVWVDYHSAWAAQQQKLDEDGREGRKLSTQNVCESVNTSPKIMAKDSATIPNTLPELNFSS